MSERFVSPSCECERCGQCGKPATNKVGEEISHDDPGSQRHNLTVYLCAEHFDNLMDRGYYRRAERMTAMPEGMRSAEDWANNYYFAFETVDELAGHIRTIQADAIASAAKPVMQDVRELAEQIKDECMDGGCSGDDDAETTFGTNRADAILQAFRAFRDKAALDMRERAARKADTLCICAGTAKAIRALPLVD